MNIINRRISFRNVWLAIAVSASLGASHTWAGGFKAELQAQSFGSTNWSSANAMGWAELDYIPTRVSLTGGAANGKTVTVMFDHTKSLGSRVNPGIQNLYMFTPSANVVIISGPTLSAPVGQDVWSYTFKVNLTDSAPGFVEFRSRLSA